MIALTNIDGRTVYVAAVHVSRIDEAGASSQWHGVRCFVRLHDGTTIECREHPDAVALMVNSELEVVSGERT